MKDTKPNLGDQINAPSTYDSEHPRGDSIAQNTATIEAEKIKKDLDAFAKEITKKFKFTISLSVLPAQSVELFEEEASMTQEEKDKKPMHILMLVPEDEYKNIPKKIKPEVVKLVQAHKQNAWVHIKTPVDVWNYGMDSKPEFVDAIGHSFPIHDTGFLGAVRVSVIHKTLVMRKFDKYVASYVVGGSVVRGTADDTSDVDTFVVIDDTDVKRMPRLQLLERLRGMIYDYIKEATALAGVTNPLNVQVYLLTDFWDNVKDANPVMFTFIRDGVPLADRGTFLPWKLLLQMGKIKPTPEAVDKFMKFGDQTEMLVNRKLLDSMVDIYYGVVTPIQALMMLAGHAPPAPKTIVQEVKALFVDKEKLMGQKELKTLEKAVKYFKDYEHGKLKKIPGKEIDQFFKEAQEYDKKMKELRKKLEQRMIEQSASQVHDELYDILKKILGTKSKEELAKQFEKELVKTGKLQRRYVNVLKEVSTLKQKAKGGKMTQAHVDSIRRDGEELVRALVEYSQRKELIAVEKGVFPVAHGKDKRSELVMTDLGAFLVSGATIQAITEKGLVASDATAFDTAIRQTKDRTNVEVPSRVLKTLSKELGDFTITT